MTLQQANNQESQKMAHYMIKGLIDCHDYVTLHQGTI